MARLIALIHMAIVTFVVTGCLWPWTAALITHAIFLPLMILHWRTNRNRCFLSELEERLKAPGETVEAEESQFVKGIWKKIFGRVPSDKAFDRLLYGIMAVSWVTSLVRLTWRLAS